MKAEKLGRNQNERLRKAMERKSKSTVKAQKT